MCSPSIIESALAGVSRREALHLAAGVFAGALTGASRGAASERPGEKRTIAADNVLDLTLARVSHVAAPGQVIQGGFYICQRRRG